MALVNPFGIFRVSEISDAIQRIPNRYGRLGQAGIFATRGVTTPVIMIEEWNGTLALIQSEQNQGPGQVGAVGKRVLRSFQIPRLIQEEHVEPAEVQAVRAFGGNEAENLARLLSEKLDTCRAKHEITHEHLRVGALKGSILDADGSTLYNLFTEFSVTQKETDFVLGTATTDVRGKCMEVVRHIEDNLLGDVMGQIRAEVSPSFFDKLVNHAKVKEAYANYQEAAQRLGGDMRDGFTFGSITFAEYRGVSQDAAGNKRRFIPDGDARVYPTGTTQTFRGYTGPADFNETVNQIGQMYYAKTVPGKFDRGWDVHTQSNYLPMCMRPAVLVRAFTSN